VFCSYNRTPPTTTPSKLLDIINCCKFSFTCYEMRVEFSIHEAPTGIFPSCQIVYMVIPSQPSDVFFFKKLTFISMSGFHRDVKVNKS